MRLLAILIHAFVVASATKLAWRELPSGVCADGTPAGYYDDAAGFDGSEPWAIYFEGGSFAASADEALDEVCDLNEAFTALCVENGRLYSSANAPATMTLGPFFDAAPLKAARKVFVTYCTGDLGLGDAARPASGGRTAYFDGARVYAEVIEDLGRRGLFDAPKITLAGSSAGGIVLATLLRRVKDRVPDTDVFLDSSWFISGGRFALLSPDERGAEVLELWNGQGRLDADCLARVADAKATVCMAWEQLLPLFADVRVFVLQSTFDPFTLFYQMLDDAIHFKTAADALYVERFAAASRQSLARAVDASAAPHSVYAPACPTHVYVNGHASDRNTQTGVTGAYYHKVVMGDGDLWNRLVVDDLKLRDVVEAWLAGGADVRVHDCETLNCNPTCGSELRSAGAAPARDATFAAFLLWLFGPLAFLYGLVFSGLRAARTFLGTRDLATAGRRAAWKSTGELGRRGRTSEISRSVTSKSIRLLFGRIDCRRRVPEAAPRIWRNQPSRTLASKSGRIFDFHAGDGRRTAASRGRSRRSATRSTTWGPGSSRWRGGRPPTAAPRGRSRRSATRSTTSSWNASSSTRSTCATACHRPRARPRAARSSAA